MEKQLLFPVGLLGFAVGVFLMVVISASSDDRLRQSHAPALISDDLHISHSDSMAISNLPDSASDHAHAMVEHAQLPAPSVSISVTSDAKAGYNVYIDAKDFTFSPQAVGGTDVFNQGHAHVYVNDAKVGRAYGPWFHIDESWFSTGENTIVVTLNSDSHNEWLVNGEHIMAKEIVVNNSLQQ